MLHCQANQEDFPLAHFLFEVDDNEERKTFNGAFRGCIPTGWISATVMSFGISFETHQKSGSELWSCALL
jgi:hypothetical protein